MNLGPTDVLNRVWREWFGPGWYEQDTFLFCGAGVEQNCAVSITAYIFSVTNQYEYSGPVMCVHGDSVPLRYTNIENSHTFVLQQDVVVFRSGDQRIERIGPWPRFLTTREIVTNCCSTF